MIIQMDECDGIHKKITDVSSKKRRMNKDKDAKFVEWKTDISIRRNCFHPFNFQRRKNKLPLGYDTIIHSANVRLILLTGQSTMTRNVVHHATSGNAHVGTIQAQAIHPNKRSPHMTYPILSWHRVLRYSKNTNDCKLIKYKMVKTSQKHPNIRPFSMRTITQHIDTWQGNRWLNRRTIGLNHS